MKNEKIKKQLCMETMSPGEALSFAVVRERGEFMYRMVSGKTPQLGKNKCNGNRSNTLGSSNAGQGGSYVEREPVKEVMGKD